MGRKWSPPGKIREPVKGNLTAFGVTSIDGARVNVTDPPTSATGQLFDEVEPPPIGLTGAGGTLPEEQRRSVSPDSVVRRRRRSGY